jgi:NitT/TauT family transport system ATP-binding protein
MDNKVQIESSIIIENLSKAYEGDIQTNYVLRNINLQVRKGEFFVLLGPSGCGKSTLLNIIAGFIPKTEGVLLVNQDQVSKPSSDRGVVFQQPDACLFPWLDVRQNVEFGLTMKKLKRSEKNRISDKFIELVGLTGHEKKFPLELSGGMKQRLQLARVLANAPDTLLMDEPFGALDAQTRRIMQQELVRIWKETKKTVIFVTHDIQEAILLGQRIGVMSPGPSSTFEKIYQVDLQYPRDITTPKFNDTYKKVLSHFEGDELWRQHDKSLVSYMEGI